jgi:Flp pilus assembly protein TadD
MIPPKRSPHERSVPARLTTADAWPCVRLALLAVLVVCHGCDQAPPAPPPLPSPVEEAPLEYVAVEICAECHAEETRRWRGSHHDLAMQVASTETVLGDFSDVSFLHEGELFEFEQREDRFLVRAPDADGNPREFEVAYTFGVAPLQQYLVPQDEGRLQALGVAWDARPAPAGGQRWFHLRPGESVPPGDLMHWTGAFGAWNTMCADCHSTNLAKGYEPAQDRYQTTWSEPNVSCEACHGAGSDHVSWAERGADPDVDGRGLVVDLREERMWSFSTGSPIAQRVPPAEATQHELDTCAPCHSRRSRIADGEPGDPFLDRYRPALLEEGLYHADGQILDEVYVWGSFLQSRMHGAGVVCSDCHDPHSLRIEEPDAVCAGCHQSEVFAAPMHHRHTAGSPGASCVACHMPSRTYMVIDGRRDHSFKVPRPDLTDAIGVPNACSSCHGDRPASWAAEALERWHGPERSARTHYGEVLDAGRRRAPGAGRELASLSRDPASPPIVRATALQLLGSQLDPSSVPSLLQGLQDPSGLVRMAAVGAAEALPPRERWSALEPILRDPVRAVRIEAGRALAAWRPQSADPNAAGALARALAEYRAAQDLDADRAEARVNLGILHAQLGEIDAAEREYRAAIRLAPYFVPAYVNLAELYRVRERDTEGMRVLEEALARVPDSGALQHALGLLLVRQGRGNEALAALGDAARLSPESTRFAYVYGVALDSAGNKERALEVLAAAERAHPGDVDLLVALATLHRDAGNLEAALGYARQLLELRPGDPATQSLVRELEASGP